MFKKISIWIAGITVVVSGIIYVDLSKLGSTAPGGASTTADSDLPVWIEMMEEPDVNLAEAKRSFDEYWNNHEHFRGDRSKAFERWYTINRNRLDPLGNVISAAQVRREFVRFREELMVEQTGSWYNYGPINVGKRNGIIKDGGRVKDIEFHPTDPDTYYVSCFKSGVFKTGDNGFSWEPLFDGRMEQAYVTRVLPSDPDVMYAGTDLGVIKSTNGGALWDETGLTSGKTNALLLKPDNESVILAGNDAGIYRTTDGGNTWSLVLSASKVEDLKVHPGNPNIIYAGTNGSESQFFRSVDGGISWTENTTDFGKGAFLKIAVSPSAPNNVYIINSRDHLGDDSFEGFYISVNSGASFSKRSGNTPCITGYRDNGDISRGQPNYNLFVVVDPTDPNLIYAGGVKSWRSQDGGFTWQQVYNDITTDGGSLHLDQLNWRYSPLTDELYAVNDGGIYLLTNTNTFAPLTNGLPIAEVYECAQSQTDPSVVAGGTMHCGVKLFRDGIWITSWGGDESTVVFDPTDDTYAYHFKYQYVSRSSDGGRSFQRIKTQGDRGEYTGTGLVDKTDPNTVYVGLLEVERTPDARGANNQTVWEKISNFGGGVKIQKIEQSEADHNIMYVSRGGSFFRSDNVRGTNPSFSNISAGLPGSGIINDIATHPTDANRVYILQGSRIYRSVDKGMSWSDISSGLPGVALLEMVYDNSSTEGIYVGTDIGVFYKDADLQSWIDYSKGLPTIRVAGMEIYYGPTREESFLTVATDGRGFWRSNLHNVQITTPNVDFESDKNEVFENGQVKFQNTSSSQNVGSWMWTFEGGIPETSIEADPIVRYMNEGTFSVSLTSISDAGSQTTTKANFINVLQLPPPVADFTVSSQEVFQGNNISFTSTSQNDPVSWEWTFEGGTPSTSNEEDPTVTYNTLGTFDVSLKVINSAGEDTKTEVGIITVVENQGTGPLQVHFEFSGNTEDSSPYQRDLATAGGLIPAYGTDHFGVPNASFDAPAESGKYLFNSYKGVGGTSARSVTAWIKTTNAGTRKTIVSWGENVSGQMFNVMVDNGNLRVEGGTCNVQNDDSSVERLDNDQWRHIAVTYDESFGNLMKDIKIYIDGVYYENQPDAGDSFNSEVVTINTSNSVNDLQVGNAGYNANYFWQGSLDDIRIYDKALTVEEIQTVMNTSSNSPPIADIDSDVTSVFIGESISFSDASLGGPDTWEWTFEGGNPGSSTEQNPSVYYQSAGSFDVTLKVTNANGSDTKILAGYISVTIPPPPSAEFSADRTQIYQGEYVSFSDQSTGAPLEWAWTFEGGVPATSSEQYPVVTYANEGSFSVSLKVTNLQGTDILEKMEFVTVSKQIEVNLDNDNYNVIVVDESCRSADDGKISISAKADYSYTAEISGEGIGESIPFSNQNPLSIEGLVSGNYNVCIYIQDAPYYEQCYQLQVGEPEDLSVYSRVSISSRTVTLELFGSHEYWISLNGDVFSTSDSNITLELDENTLNILKIWTARVCQGTYEETLILNDKDVVFPNPISHELHIALKPGISVPARVAIYSRTGRLILQTERTSENGILELDVSQLEKGLYMVVIESEMSKSYHRIVKL